MAAAYTRRAGVYQGRTDVLTCPYFFADFDACGLPAGHEGNHAVFGPKCEAVNENGVRCQEPWDHAYDHVATLHWKDSE